MKNWRIGPFPPSTYSDFATFPSSFATGYVLLNLDWTCYYQIKKVSALILSLSVELLHAFSLKKEDWCPITSFPLGYVLSYGIGWFLLEVEVKSVLCF